jgi:hypothetical protein
MLKCAVMKHLDIMIGIDLHICWPPGSPLPLPNPMPYLVVMPMCGTFLTAVMAPTALTLSQMTMKRGTDIGPLIPHIGPPSKLTPMDILLSGSASHFGPSAVVVEGAPVAAALLYLINPNLNCNSSCPLPTGLVLCFTTHYVGMTLFDVMFGVFTSVLTIAIDVATASTTGLAVKQLQKHVIQPLGKKVAAKVASKTAAKATPTVPAAKWQSALPSKTPPGGAPPAKAAAPPAKAGGHRPTAKPGAWQSAKPSNPGAKGSSPSNPGVKPGAKPPAAKPPAAKPPAAKLKQTMQQKIEEKLGEMADFSVGYLLQTPFGMVNDMTLKLLAETGVEEFGGGEKRESAAKPKKEADTKGGDKKEPEEKS